MSEWVRLGVGVVILAGLAVGVLRFANVPQGRSVVVATLRAAVQLAGVALALRGVFSAPVAVVGVLAVMMSVAVWTASRRLQNLAGARRAVAIACLAGTAV